MLSLLASVSSRKVCARNINFLDLVTFSLIHEKYSWQLEANTFFTMKVPSWRTLLFLLIVVIDVSFCQSDTVAATRATNSSSE